MRIFLFSLFIAILCLTAAQSFSTIYYVNGTTGNDAWDGLAIEWDGTHGPKKTIQGGIDASSDTDVVTVADGTYKGDGNRDIDFRGKAIVLVSANGAESTIIDCEGTISNHHRGFYFHLGEGQDSVLQGFTISNGYVMGNYQSGCGGGILVDFADPTIRKCIIVDNAAQKKGGGIYCYFCDDILIEDCAIIGNSAYAGAGVSGIVDQNSRIQRCVVSGNYGDQGGGIYMVMAGGSAIDSCVISDNTADDYGGGIYIYKHSEQEIKASLVNCIIAGNKANSGGGIRTEGDRTVFINTAVCRNYAVSDGGGAVLWSPSSVYDSILWGNSPNNIGNYVDPDSELHNCDVGGGWLGTGTGNIDKDPLFIEGSSGIWTAAGALDVDKYQVTFTDASASWQVNEFAGKLVNPDTTQPLQFYIVSNTANTITVWADWQTIDAGASWVTGGDSYQIYDYHLTSSSPCIDTGTNSAPNLPSYDLDGNHRVWFGNTSWTVDMGAYEFGSQPLKIKEMSLTPEGYVELTWNSNVLPGAAYTVMYSDDEYSATISWSVLQAGIPSDGPETSYVDTTAPTGVQRYYKVLDE